MRGRSLRGPRNRRPQITSEFAISIRGQIFGYRMARENRHNYSNLFKFCGRGTQFNSSNFRNSRGLKCLDDVGSCTGPAICRRRIISGATTKGRDKIMRKGTVQHYLHKRSARKFNKIYMVYVDCT